MWLPQFNLLYYNQMTEQEEQMRIAVYRKVEQHYDKMVRDSKQVAGYNYSKYGQDLLAFTISEFLTKKDISYQYKVAVQDDKLLNYIGRAMSLGIKSHTSPFWIKYRRDMYNARGIYEVDYEGSNGKPIKYEPEFIDENFDVSKQYKSPTDCMEYAVEQLDFYYGALIEQYYYQGKTLQQISDYYNIPKYSVQQDLKAARKIIKEHCNHF